MKNEKERLISERQMDFKKSSVSSSLNSTYNRSENGYGFKRPGLKTGVKYGQDLENRAAHAHSKFPGILPPTPGYLQSI